MRSRLFPESTTNTRPVPSTATPSGEFNEALSGAPASQPAPNTVETRHSAAELRSSWPTSL